jgi:hypothetical protein
MPPKVWFIGRAHPRTDGKYYEPLKGKPGFDFQCFSDKELRSISTKGKPIHINHLGESTKIGKVADDFHDSTGAKYVVGYINLNKPHGRYVHELLKKDMMNELSLSFNSKATPSQDNKSIHIEKKIIELSVTDKARRTDRSCRIIDFVDDDGLTKFVGEIKQKIGTVFYIIYPL